MNTLRVGLVGFGYAGATFHAPLIDAVAGLELVKIASSRPQAVAAARPGTEVVPAPQALFADPSIDLVVVTSPNDSHARLAREALEAGKHVVVEKPFVLHAAEGEALEALARSQGRVLSVFHNRRWDGDFLTVKRLIESGALGEIHTFESHFDRFRPQVRDRWRESSMEGAGLLYDLGPHLIDQTLQLFGAPQTVYADLCLQRNGARAVDYAHLLLDYGRRRVILHAAALVRAPTPRFLIQGSRASYVKYGLDAQEAQLRCGKRPGAPDWGREDESQYGRLIADDGTARTIETQRGCYENYYEKLVDAIRGRGGVPVTADDGTLSIRVIEAALQSAREGRRIAFA